MTSQNPEITRYLEILTCTPGTAGFHGRPESSVPCERYLVVPGTACARWILPLRGSRWLRAAIAAYRPWRVPGKIGRACLLALGRCPGLCARLFPVVHLDQEPATDFLVQCREVFSESDVVVGCSLGTPGPDRKLTVHVMDRSAATLGFVKVAASARAGELVDQERSILGELARHPGLDGAAPSVIWHGELQSYRTLFLTPAPDDLATERLGRIHVDFLLKLIHGERKPAGAFEGYAKLLEDVEKARGSLSPDAMEALDAAVRTLRDTLEARGLQPVIAHGDFAPWNLRVRDDALFAFDWEYGSMETIPMVDVLHFIVQTGFLLEGWTAARAHGNLPAVLRIREVTSYRERLALSDEDVYGTILFYLVEQVTRSCAATEGEAHRVSLDQLQAGKLELLRLVMGSEPESLVN